MRLLVPLCNRASFNSLAYLPEPSHHTIRKHCTACDGHQSHHLSNRFLRSAIMPLVFISGSRAPCRSKWVLGDARELQDAIVITSGEWGPRRPEPMGCWVLGPRPHGSWACYGGGSRFGDFGLFVERCLKDVSLKRAFNLRLVLCLHLKRERRAQGKCLGFN